MPRVVAPLVVVAAIALAYWPALGGFWGRDDFMQLAFVRLLGSPWALFAHDHYFPVPGSIFRPLGFASFWLSQALFGTDYAANALGDLTLHAAVALALYRVVRAGEIERAPAVLCALAFALHPAVLGTALWWSARFDLLAALFAFVALRAALDYVTHRRPMFLCIALLSTLLALLSKEVALAGVAAVGIAWLRWFLIDRSNRATARRALILLAIVIVVYFAWRAAVLGTVTTGLVGDAPLLPAIGKGITEWLAHLGGYLSFWSQLGAAQRIVLAIGASAAIACLAAGASMSRAARWSLRQKDLLLCGACLFVLPALLQAPVTALNAAPLAAGASAIEAAMQSRLYYLSFGGLAIALSVFVGRAFRLKRRWQLASCAALGLVAIAFGAASHRAATRFAATSSEPRAMAEAAVAAVDGLTLPTERCHVVLLGAEPPPEWSVYVSMDSVVKALTSQPRRVGRCFIHADYVTYFHLMDAAATPRDADPYRDRKIRGGALPWLRIGDVEVAYLDPPPDARTADTTGILFLRYEQGTFRDVSADVAAGRVAVELR